MLDALRGRLDQWKAKAVDRAWLESWKAARSVATPWKKREYAAAVAKLRALGGRDVVIARAVRGGRDVGRGPAGAPPRRPRRAARHAPGRQAAPDPSRRDERVGAGVRPVQR